MSHAVSSDPDIGSEESPQFLRAPGTVSAAGTGRVTPTRRFVVPLIVGATMVLGTVAAVTPADAAAYHVGITQTSTRSGRLMEENTGGADQVASALLRLREVSGLTWGETAAALGVSRRAIHHWAAGARLSARHAERLRSLAELIARNDVGDAHRTRALLVAPDDQGHSPISIFASTYRRPRPNPLSSQSLAGVLEAATAIPAGPPRAHLSRTSSLGVRALGRAAKRDP
jgi:hypothetical protein